MVRCLHAEVATTAGLAWNTCDRNIAVCPLEPSSQTAAFCTTCIAPCLVVLQLPTCWPSRPTCMTLWQPSPAGDRAATPAVLSHGQALSVPMDGWWPSA